MSHRVRFRRLVISAAVWWLCVTTPPLFSLAARDALLRVESGEEVMGTTFSVVLYGRDRAVLEAAARAAFDEAQRLDRMLSNYRPTSEWSGLNQSAANGPVRVSAELFDLLSASFVYSRSSDGAFDITVGPLMKVWGFYKGEGALPPAEAVAAALDHVGYRHVTLDPVGRTVQFDRQNVEIDPGGIGKGYAVDRMVDVVRGRGVTIAKISAGGSSIYGLGAPPEDSRGWKLTIRTPGDPSHPAGEVFLRDASLSTSGSYEKFFWANGRTYSHIMDPRTGYPARGASSVSVIAPRTIDSEAWTKPYFVNGRAWTTSHLQYGFRVFYCDDATPAACGWIRDKSEVGSQK